MGALEARYRHVTEVSGPVVRVFGRQRMGGEPAGGAKHRDLAFDGKAVAGLDLDRADAFGEQAVEPGQGRRHHAVDVERQRGAHRRGDAAAGPCDLLVARAFEPGLELGAAVAAVDEVGVAVDERRGQQPALAIDDPPAVAISTAPGAMVPHLEGRGPAQWTRALVQIVPASAISPLPGPEKSRRGNFPRSPIKYIHKELDLQSPIGLNGGSMRIHAECALLQGTS